MLVTEEHDGLILVPIPVLTEVRSGRRSTDVLVDRLLSAIGDTNSIYAPLTVETASRAGVLRAAAQVGLRRPISAIDAQVVAIGEERSYRRAVTIVTTDRTDIAALVEVTGRSNIAIHAV
jgi:predicted RNase H-like nuclease